ncbi:MAG: CheR family methyltransferase [Burkholderiaceae bacterium]
MKARSDESGRDWARLSAFASSTLGLQLPAERGSSLSSALGHVAQELGLDEGACLQWLPTQSWGDRAVQILADHLTVGETYFFRDLPALEGLLEHVPSALDNARRQRRPLRIWSAGCCSGEEAYTLAILIQRRFGRLSEDDLAILATDVNSKFLQKAAQGRYSDWSFRNTPEWLRSLYFSDHFDGSCSVIPDIRRWISFKLCNLASANDVEAAIAGQPVDIIVCRNVLMYLSPAHRKRIVARFRQCLAEGGLLLAAPAEVPLEASRGFVAANPAGTLLIRSSAQPPAAVRPFAARSAEPAGGGRVPGPQAPPRSASQISAIAAADAAPAGGSAAAAIADAHQWSTQARAWADRGELGAALECCDRWLAHDPLDARGHYLRAAVLIECNELSDAEAALRRAIYIDADFVLAHFALGNIALRRGNGEAARRHLGTTRRLLLRHVADEVLYGSDGLTARRLDETLRAMLVSGHRHGN